MRLFLAILPDEEFRNSLLEMQRDMKRHGIRGSYTPPENLHLTLAFLGEYQDPDGVMDALNTVPLSPFSIRLEGAGAFDRVFWAGVAAMGTLLPSEVYQELLPLPDFSTQELMQVMSSRWGYLTICIFAPLVEEVVFRGAVLRSLLQRMNSRWGAIALSAFLFALVHLNPAQMPHAFLIGLLLGWMYERTRSILPGIMVHWVNNTVVYVVYNLLPNLSERPVYDLFGGDWKRIALSVLFSLLILLPALWQLHTRMKPAQEEIFPKYE